MKISARFLLGCLCSGTHHLSSTCQVYLFGLHRHLVAAETSDWTLFLSSSLSQVCLWCPNPVLMYKSYWHLYSVRGILIQAKCWSFFVANSRDLLKLMEPSWLTPAKYLALHVMDSNHLATHSHSGVFHHRKQPSTTEDHFNCKGMCRLCHWSDCFSP